MINAKILNIVLNKSITSDISFDALGDVYSIKSNTLTYCNSKEYFLQAINNYNITGIICSNELSLNFKTDKTIIESKNPGYDFILLHNYYHSKKTSLSETQIHPSVNVHSTAFISETGVIIEENVIIGPYVIVYPNVIIKSNTSVGAHSVLGCEDIEAKKSDLGYINAIHDGGLVIGNSCFVGSGVIISRGVYGKMTTIGNNTFISNNSIIAHGVSVGENCMILGCHICGSVNIGNNVRINPKVVISNGLTIGNNATILLGSVVIADVENGITVSGHYAIEHPRFLYKFVKLFGKIKFLMILFLSTYLTW
jgi:UDP-3-O-[3-hydroxymyristoyl] glucosamine N-acyltransferase